MSGGREKPDRPGVLSLIGDTPLVPIRALNPRPPCKKKTAGAALRRVLRKPGGLAWVLSLAHGLLPPDTRASPHAGLGANGGDKRHDNPE